MPGHESLLGEGDHHGVARLVRKSREAIKKFPVEALLRKVSVVFPRYIYFLILLMPKQDLALAFIQNMKAGLAELKPATLNRSTPDKLHQPSSMSQAHFRYLLSTMITTVTSRNA